MEQQAPKTWNSRRAYDDYIEHGINLTWLFIIIYRRLFKSEFGLDLKFGTLKRFTEKRCPRVSMPDCGSSSCRYATKRTGMRTNGGCRCDECPLCGAHIRPTSPVWHRQWCKIPAWVPRHHKNATFSQHEGLSKEEIELLSQPPEPIKILVPAFIEEDEND